MGKLLEQGIKELQLADTIEQYDKCLGNLDQILCGEGYSSDIIHTVRIKGKYMINRFSDEATRESMLRAKENLIAYLECIPCKDIKRIEDTMQVCLEKYLHNFYSFLEAFREAKPHKKATLDSGTLQDIQIRNEYDLQHILYAVIKPLFMDARVEVTEDTGCGTVRSDIKIPSLDAIVETKCTRGTMSVKKLMEEIEADIVHYNASFIYFYVYDKEKIIKNQTAFENAFNKMFDGKQIGVIVLQPVYM